MNKRLSLIPLLLMIQLGCKKDPSICCVVIDTGMRIAVQSSSKLDLLDSTSGKFNNDNIDVFDKTESGYIRVFDANMDQPKRFRIAQNPTTKNYELNLGLNTNVIGGVSETLVKFGDNVPDTIRAVILKNGGVTTVSKVSVGSITFNSTELYTFIKD